MKPNKQPQKTAKAVQNKSKQTDKLPLFEDMEQPRILKIIFWILAALLFITLPLMMYIRSRLSVAFSLIQPK